MKDGSKIREEGQGSRGVEGHSKEKLFLPDRLQPLCESFGMEATSPAWMEIASNRASAPKGIDVAAPFLMGRKGKGTFRGQGRTLSSNWGLIRPVAS